jgi:hypothetical protein
MHWRPGIWRPLRILFNAHQPCLDDQQHIGQGQHHVADQQQGETFGLLQPAQKQQQGNPQHHFRNHDRRQQQGVEGVLAGELEADERQAARMPMPVEMTAVSDPRTSEF